MTIINDLAAAGIECEEAVRYDELRDFMGDVATGQYPKAADAMFSALARIAIECKRIAEAQAEFAAEQVKARQKAEAERDQLEVYVGFEMARSDFRTATEMRHALNHARDLVVALEGENARLQWMLREAVTYMYCGGGFADEADAMAELARRYEERVEVEG